MGGVVTEPHDEESFKYFQRNCSDPRVKTIKKDENVPKVGDVVRLNNYGLEQIFGSAIGKSFIKSKEFRVTGVDDVSITYPEPTFGVEVDDPEINQFLIDHLCFDIVRRCDHNRIPDKRKPSGKLSWSRAFSNAWRDGWDDAARDAVITEYYEDRAKSELAALAR